MTTPWPDPPGTLAVPALLQLPYEALVAAALQRGLTVPTGGHDALAAALLADHLERGGGARTEGVLALLPEGFGFVRLAARDWQPTSIDAFVAASQVRQFRLQDGQSLSGPVRAPRRGERSFVLVEPLDVNGRTPAAPPRPWFTDRRAVLPTRRLRFGDDVVARWLERLAPLGRGHRALVVVPSTFAAGPWLARLAAGCRQRDRDLAVWLCLCDQRPESAATARTVAEAAGVRCVASPFGAPPAEQLALAERALAAALRDVEADRDVLLLLDSLTTLTRAAGRAAPVSGCWATPGLDVAALQPGKRLFASARQCAEGGSLTVIATIENGDDSAVAAAVLREFAPFASASITIDAALLARCAEPPIDVLRTDVRREDDLRSRDERSACCAARATWPADPTAAHAACARWIDEAPDSAVAPAQRPGR